MNCIGRLPAPALQIEIKCEFCGLRYEMTPEAIKADLDAQATKYFPKE